jgi:hypothetical protein
LAATPTGSRTRRHAISRIIADPQGVSYGSHKRGRWDGRQPGELSSSQRTLAGVAIENL